MKMLATAALMSGLMVLAGAAPAVAAADAAKPPKEKKICHTEVMIGSIMPKSVCHTKAEWAQIDATNSDNAHQALEQPRGTEAERPR